MFASLLSSLGYVPKNDADLSMADQAKSFEAKIEKFRNEINLLTLTNTELATANTTMTHRIDELQLEIEGLNAAAVDLNASALESAQQVLEMQEAANAAIVPAVTGAEVVLEGKALHLNVLGVTAKGAAAKVSVRQLINNRTNREVLEDIADELKLLATPPQA